MEYDDYMSSVEQQVLAAGFTEHSAVPSEAGAEVAWHKRNFQLTKFGMVDTFIIPRQFDEHTLNQNAVSDFGSGCFSFSTSHKFFMPRGLFSALVVHPLVVVESTGPAVKEFITEEYNPKHWSATEFPALYELSTGELYRYTETPLWGAAYYSGLRDNVDEWLLPAGQLPE